ncbi:MAG: hypothetical protein ACHQ9S_24290 [Candidatus Binatia bacterium]
MTDPKSAKPWHGIPREQIDWHPTMNEAACIGCGTFEYFEFLNQKAIAISRSKRAPAALQQREGKAARQ